MEVTIQANVEAKAYFDFILSTVQTSLEVAGSNEKIKKGITFEKSLNTGFMKTEMCKVKVTDYVYPKIIELDYVSKSGTNTIRYVILPKGKDACEVTYRETKYDANHVEKKIGAWSEKGYRKKLEKRMNAVTQYLIEQKNKNETNTAGQ
ncbi:DUF3284 domain-containing protein [uncultured Traorella sp.]|uniref:DUF3284 domain-containing protein n=1 Tax=uncultured Traorella sp. TaxID=1929048 RepID=UPI0025FCA7C8|nr:DUF3284 domain-containing protein [uncultured Traorella sp.]